MNSTAINTNYTHKSKLIKCGQKTKGKGKKLDNMGNKYLNSGHTYKKKKKKQNSYCEDITKLQ